MGKPLNENLTLEPSESLAYILGVLECKGGIYKTAGNDRIAIFTKHKDLADNFEKHLRNIGFISVGRYITKKSLHSVQASSKCFSDWYKSLNKYDDYIKMFGEDEELCKMFLRGVFDAIGYVYTKRGFIRLQKYNRDILDLTQQFLEKFDIESKIYYINLKKKDIKYYRLFILKKDSILKFRDEINFSIIKKREALDKLCQQIIKD